MEGREGRERGEALGRRSRMRERIIIKGALGALRGTALQKVYTLLILGYKGVRNPQSASKVKREIWGRLPLCDLGSSHCASAHYSTQRIHHNRTTKISEGQGSKGSCGDLCVKYIALIVHG